MWVSDITRRHPTEIKTSCGQVGQSKPPPYSAGDRQIAFGTATAALRFACRTLLALPGAAVAIPFCVHVSTTDGVALLPCAIAVTHLFSRAPCALRNRRQDEITIGRTRRYSCIDCRPQLELGLEARSSDFVKWEDRTMKN